MNPLNRMIGVAVLAGVVGAGVALGGAWKLGAFSQPSAQVAVVNLGGLIRSATNGKPVDKGAINRGFKKMEALGEALAARGYLVLDASAVINAPADLYIPRRRPETKRNYTDLLPDRYE